MLDSIEIAHILCDNKPVGEAYDEVKEIWKDTVHDFADQLETRLGDFDRRRFFEECQI